MRLFQLFAVVRDREALGRYVRLGRDESTFVSRSAGRISPIGLNEAVVKEMARLREYLRRSGRLQKHRMLHWYTSEARVGKLRYSLARLVDLRIAYGFDVTVVIVPFLDQQNHGAAYQMVYRIVELELERADFDVLNVYADFEEAGFDVSVGNRLHPNELGHAIIAERIHRHLVSRFTERTKGPL